MAAEDIGSRLAALEQRLAAIEARVGIGFAWPAKMGLPPAPPAPPPGPPADPRPALSAGSPGARVDAESTRRTRSAGRAPQASGDPGSRVTNVLGWGGGVAFVLAAAYLIRLGIDNGWLTPTVQVATAAVAGLLLAGAGFALRGRDERYAGYLPACGVAILFLAIYGAHLLYGLIGARSAALDVVCVCALSLWLCRAFRSDLYALFAVAGSYSAPFLLQGAHGSITDVVIYFSAWSVVFSVYAIWYGRRLIYLLAAYLAMVGFDVIWHLQAPAEWVPAISFQAVQFAIFGVATAAFSIRRGEPLVTGAAFAHLPLLLLFYALQYGVLDRHLPALAPWISVASLAAVALLYFGARRILDRPLPGGELLLWCYLSLVLFHAGYLEAWPRAWAPWASFILIPVAGLATLRRRQGLGAAWVLWAVVGVIFLFNYLRVIADFSLAAVPGHSVLAIAYAALLYAGYALVARRAGLREVKNLLVYAGHISAMAAAVHLLDVRIVESTAWGLLALACLAFSIATRDRVLGQSSLLLFGATAAKVLLSDLSGAQPLARIVSLVVLGATFYVGGLFYQRLMTARRDAAGLDA